MNGWRLDAFWPRTLGCGSRKLAALMMILFCVAGVRAEERFTSAHQMLTNTVALFHEPSAEARGAERKRLLMQAAERYEQLLARFPTETNVCAQALRGLGNVHASLGRTNEAVKSFEAVGERFGGEGWEVLMAWKSAADLLWEGGRRDEAKQFYRRIVVRFDQKDASQVIQAVVRGSKRRLNE